MAAEDLATPDFWVKNLSPGTLVVINRYPRFGLLMRPTPGIVVDTKEVFIFGHPQVLLYVKYCYARSFTFTEAFLWNQVFPICQFTDPGKLFWRPWWRMRILGIKPLRRRW
jgi:hypothetical protein